MLFNSLEFGIFFPLVFIVYWFVLNKNLKLQNLWIVISSYFFYGWWDWRFLSLIAFSSLVDYFAGIQIERNANKIIRKRFLWLSMIVNLGLLGFFKYYNFFIDNFIAGFSLLGYKFEGHRLEVILPVGISFYTFQTMSYTIDVYRRQLKPTRDFIAFSAFVSFFPQLVAGPIERATNLLPQFYKSREFDYGQAVDGMRQMLWGFFKKMVIADQCAAIVNPLFESYHEYNGSSLLMGGFLFALQIYGDFSGYSDIAIGTAKLFGFQLMQNFAFPYFSRDIAEFWRRWHISLSTWFRDYLYIPLGGSRGGTWQKIRNTFIIFLVSGFWHGANWTFIAWGFINACYFLPLLILEKNRTNLDIVAKGNLLPSWKELLNMIVTFLLTILAWIFFRAESLTMAIDYISKMLSPTLFERPLALILVPKFIIFPMTLFFIIEWIGREGKHPLEYLGLTLPRAMRWALYCMIALNIVLFARGDKIDFIYFQF